MRRLIFLAIVPILASCTASEPQPGLAAATPQPESAAYETAMPATAYAAPEYSGPRLPGRWGIYVDATAAPASYRSADPACSGRSYDLPADAVIRSAFLQTSNNAFEMARELAAPPRGGNLGGLTWALAIRVTKAEGGLVGNDASTGSFGRAQLRAEITVLDSRGETIRTMTESAAAMSDEGPAGCDGGEALLTLAWQRASNALMSEIVPELGTN